MRFSVLWRLRGKEGMPSSILLRRPTDLSRARIRQSGHSTRVSFAGLYSTQWNPIVETKKSWKTYGRTKNTCRTRTQRTQQGVLHTATTVTAEERWPRNTLSCGARATGDGDDGPARVSLCAVCVALGRFGCEDAAGLRLEPPHSGQWAPALRSPVARVAHGDGDTGPAGWSVCCERERGVRGRGARVSE